MTNFYAIRREFHWSDGVNSTHNNAARVVVKRDSLHSVFTCQTAPSFAQMWSDMLPTMHICMFAQQREENTRSVSASSWYILLCTMSGRNRTWWMCWKNSWVSISEIFFFFFFTLEGFLGDMLSLALHKQKQRGALPAAKGRSHPRGFSRVSAWIGCTEGCCLD